MAENVESEPWQPPAGKRTSTHKSTMVKDSPLFWRASTVNLVVLRCTACIFHKKFITEPRKECEECSPTGWCGIRWNLATGCIVSRSLAFRLLVGFWMHPDKHAQFEFFHHSKLWSPKCWVLLRKFSSSTGKLEVQESGMNRHFRFCSFHFMNCIHWIHFWRSII